MPTIHPTAIISTEAELAPDVEIGPQCVLIGRVKLAAGVKLIGHVYLHGPVEIGSGTMVFPFACVGFPGQDYKFKPGDPTAGVIVGSNSILREHTTIHAATKLDAPTRVGDRVFMMANAHVGHDATVGNNVIMVNNAAIGGHSFIEDNATLSAGTLIHQFVRIGRLAFISGGTPLSMNVPPFCTAWSRNALGGLNLVGMRRGGMKREDITEVRRAFRECIYRSDLTRSEMIERLTELGQHCEPVAEMARFVAQSSRAICPYRSNRDAVTQAEPETV